MNTKESSPRAALLVVANSSVFSFEQPVISIGRASDNDLVIYNTKVSRKHAELRYQEGEFEISDLSSTGGTYVNGNKIDKFTSTVKDRKIQKNLLLICRLPPFGLSFKDREILSSHACFLPPPFRSYIHCACLANFERCHNSYTFARTTWCFLKAESFKELTC